MLHNNRILQKKKDDNNETANEKERAASPTTPHLKIIEDMLRKIESCKRKRDTQNPEHSRHR